MDARAISHKYRSIWISDIHLGTPGCKANFLLDFLRSTKSENLYLVGDIIDGWSLQQGWYWPQAHNDVVQKIMRKARQGTRVVFIPGNHDEFARNYVDHDFGSIQVVHEIVHTTADGRKFLVLHGDEFDVVVKYARWLAYLGDWSYGLCLKLNDTLNAIRQRLGYPYWSLSAYLKLKVKNAVKFIADFENALADVAKDRGVNGVICGHIHHPEIREINGVTYCNDGDWVESCSALVEHFDGRLELIHWMGAVASLSDIQGNKSCDSSSLPMPGILKSMGLFGRSRT
ncbi:UDP-2,3-diacylglucosamine diphosphatase [Sneathiella sp. HT1-7]|jgi:UDP-2,3-diacylglucosamine pyrophosphatase LpxH|uniref:UDP-2,3-diacylglucosamine diphosphatase n=1 Tax=Sneathiella sp. HT1-7 TaxID=2887192 RepID=UPI001D133A36|nr:UDP-2,3-diacylglucosamine diphosphatase [Sneathiella sp. HT1-7]MCC3304226.1 UDP-2,3-diacylglucosamine diphosphatase [Sneathiella sp. HT1-7]